MALVLMLLAILALTSPVAAQGQQEPFWKKWLRSPNSNVELGNERLRQQEHEDALAQYDLAARSLPGSGGVHLNRGLALLAGGDRAAARQALLLGTQPPAPRDVRADAHYNLGRAFYFEGDAAAAEDNHELAQKHFRESVGASKQTLRLRPGDRNAAWNLELALRRLREEEQKAKDQEDQQQDQDQDEKQDDQKQDDQKQDQQKQDDQKQDDQKQDQQKQDQQKQPPEPQPAPPPSEVDRALDALQDGEENLERLRARQRAARERRKPGKDW